MNKLNKTEFAFFFILIKSLLSKDLFNQNLFFVTAGAVSCGGSKTSHGTSVQSIFSGSLGSLCSFLVI